MKKANYIVLISGLLMLTMASCSVVGGIFKAGMGVGIFIVVIIIVLILVIVSKVNKK